MQHKAKYFEAELKRFYSHESKLFPVLQSFSKLDAPFGDLVPMMQRLKSVYEEIKEKNSLVMNNFKVRNVIIARVFLKKNLNKLGKIK